MICCAVTSNKTLVLLGLACLFACVMLSAPTTRADENRLSWSTQLQAEYDSNSQLRSDDEISLAGTRLQTGIDYSKKSAASQLTTHTTLYNEKYNRSEYDFEGYLLNAQFQKNGETYIFTIDVDSDRQSTRVSELTDTGTVTNAASYRLENAISTLWHQQLNEQNSLYTNVNFTRIDYESATFADYNNWGATLGWQYQLNTLTLWQVQTSYSEYTSELTQNTDLLRQNSEVEAETKSIQVALQRQLAENLDLKLSLGQLSTQSTTEQFFDFSNQTIVNESDGELLIANVAANYAMRRSNISLEWMRNTQGSGSGSLTEINKNTIRYNYDLSPTSRLDVNLYYSEQDGFLSEIARQSREYYRIYLGLQKQLSRQFTTRLGFDYRTQKYSNSNERPESYSATLSLQYIPYSTLW